MWSMARRNKRLTCAYNEIAPIIVFGWLLTAEQHKATQEWAQEVLAAASVRSGHASSPSSGAGETTSVARKKAVSRGQVKVLVSDLWK